MTRIEKKTKRYPSDLTNEEWSVIKPFLPKRSGTGRPRRTDLREVLNAIRYMVRFSCDRPMLPIHFAPWQTVYWWFRRFVRQFLFRTIHDVVLMIDRERAGRNAQPSAAVVDSHSIKAPAAGGSKRWPWIKHLFADGAYDRRQLLDKVASLNFAVEIVRRTDAGFEILPRRWVVERTFWLTRYRRLVRDYEARIDVFEAIIDAAMAGLSVRRVTH